MPFFRYLSISGIRLLLETQLPLTDSKAFTPFLTEPAEPDFRAVFRCIDRLPSVPRNVLFSEECYRIAMDKNGNIQKFFFETPENPVHYAVSTYDRISGHIRVEYLDAYRHCVSEVRNCFYHLGFESLLLRRNKLSLHAACIQTSFGGILFSGKSGIGKSTQAELWCRYRGARQINGDRPILSKEQNGWVAWGSPYAGSSKCYVNDNCPVTAIVMLQQAKTCSLRRLSPSEAFRAIWSGLTVRSWERDFVDNASRLALDMVSAVPVFELSCTPDEQAVICLEQELGKECPL